MGKCARFLYYDENFFDEFYRDYPMSAWKDMEFRHLSMQKTIIKLINSSLALLCRCFMTRWWRRQEKARSLWKWWRTSSPISPPSIPSTASFCCQTWRNAWANGERVKTDQLDPWTRLTVNLLELSVLLYVLKSSFYDK